MHYPWNSPETKILALEVAEGTQVQDDQEGWRKKTGENRRGENQNNGLGDKPSDSFFVIEFLLWREQNQFVVLGITQIPVKSLTPNSFKREGAAGIVFLYLWDPSWKNNVSFLH